MLKGEIRLKRAGEAGKTESCYGKKLHITCARRQREAVVPLKIFQPKGNLLPSPISFVWLK